MFIRILIFILGSVLSYSPDSLSISGSKNQKKLVTPVNEDTLKQSNEVMDNDDRVLEIPGLKLDIESARKIKIKWLNAGYKLNDYDKINLAVKKYLSLKYSGKNNYEIYGFYDLNDYILIYCNEPGVRDGGFDLVYKKSLHKIIGYFYAGERG